MVLVYSLALDENYLKSLLDAADSPGPGGLGPEIHRLAELPIMLVDGTIQEARWESMGDWPGFTMLDSNGERSSWTREGKSDRYVPGLRVRVAWTDIPLKDRKPSKVVREIWVEDSPRRLERKCPGPHGVLERGHFRALEIEPKQE